eukprot:COSAG01_NODE_60946_length_292_cov_0.533679_1_plen_63_part_10
MIDAPCSPPTRECQWFRAPTAPQSHDRFGQALVPEAVLGSGALMNLGGDRDHSGHKVWRGSVA